jgi:hypothetical protein
MQKENTLFAAIPNWRVTPIDDFAGIVGNLKNAARSLFRPSMARLFIARSNMV